MDFLRKLEDEFLGFWVLRHLQQEPQLAKSVQPVKFSDFQFNFQSDFSGFQTCVVVSWSVLGKCNCFITWTDDVMKRASNMDNQGIVGFQRQIMRDMEEEAHYLILCAPLMFVILFMPHSNHSCVLIPCAEQDEGLEKLEETVVSTKHIALAVNEELTLHTRLLNTLDDHVESSNSGLQRIRRRLAMFNKRTKGGCTCLCLLVILIVLLILIVFALIKYL